MSTQYQSLYEATMQAGEQEPLLSRVASPAGSIRDCTSSEESGTTIAEGTTRSVEDDVLPETSTLGRTITWSSAYILVISRVIGSGIFATPGVIVRDVGSVGLSLSLWLVGAIIAACGLVVGLEYGCMLPRSGGEKASVSGKYSRCDASSFSGLHSKQLHRLRAVYALRLRRGSYGPSTQVPCGRLTHSHHDHPQLLLEDWYPHPELSGMDQNRTSRVHGSVRLLRGGLSQPWKW
jgi:hypothetical protein